MIDHQTVDSMFEYLAPVDEQIDDTKPLEQLGACATRFAHDLVDILPPGPLLTAALVKLQGVVSTAADAIRIAQARQDRRDARDARVAC